MNTSNFDDLTEKVATALATQRAAEKYGSFADDPLTRMNTLSGVGSYTGMAKAALEVIGKEISSNGQSGELFPIFGNIRLSDWQGWDQSRMPWSEVKHKDAVCAAVFGPAWSMEDANALIGFIDRTWGRGRSIDH